MLIFDYDKKKFSFKDYLENDLKTEVINNIKSVNKITCDITKKAVNVTAKNASASIEKLKQLYGDCKVENLYDKASILEFEFLKKKGAIPDNIYKLCDIIRQIGNKGVHTENIINKDVKQIIKYFHEISIWLNGKYF